MRRFPRPWTVEAIEAGFKVIDANGQPLAYVYGSADAHHAQVSRGLTLDEARRIASNIAKLPRRRIGKRPQGLERIVELLPTLQLASRRCMLNLHIAVA
jgi:hypothetical protein